MDPDSLPFLFDGITFIQPAPADYIALGAGVLLLVCSAVVSASETAFFSLTPSDLNSIDESGHSSDERIAALREDSERLLATILISNNLVNVAIISVLNYFIFQCVCFSSPLMEFLITTVVLTFLLLLFGEIMPKIYSAGHALSFCRRIAPALFFLNSFFRPISSLLMKTGHLTTNLLPEEDHQLSVDELDQALELTDKQDIAQERQMLKGIIRFGGETVREVMTSRLDMLALELHTPYNEVLQCIVDNNYSRIPVYDGTQDNIKGILYIKDLLQHLGKPSNFRWQSLIRPAYFVPETKMIDDLLRDFQKSKVHIAIVVDEFGGTSGLATMEDLIEEIVGEINDEYDDEEDSRLFTRLNQNTYLFEAKTQLSDFFKIMQLDDDFFAPVEGEADTLAGLLLEIEGGFPELNKRIVYRHFTFEVMEMDERRILKIKVIQGKQKKEE